MKKHFIKVTVVSSSLLLTACSDVDITFVFWSFVLVVIGTAVWETVKAGMEKREKEDARSIVAKSMSSLPARAGTGKRGRVPIAPGDMLVDVGGRGGIAIDVKNKRVGIVRDEHSQPVMVSYRDVLASEILEDGETVTKTSRDSQLGGALLGGLVLGGVGAIIGGLSGSTKSTEEISKIALMITINDVDDPVHYVMLLDDKNGHKKSSAEYKDAMGAAQRWHGKIKVLIHQADKEDRRKEKKAAAKTVTVAPQESLADQLAKLAKLRDQGILTKKEFADQKAKLLDSG